MMQPHRSTASMLLTHRWITTVGIVASIVFACVALNFVPPQYTATGTAVLVPPRQVTNPYLQFNGSVSQTAVILMQTLNDPESAAQVALLDPADTYVVTNDAAGAAPGNNGSSGAPYLTVTATTAVPARSEAVVSQVLDIARSRLADQQRTMRVFKRNTISLETLTSVPAEMSPGSSVRAVGAVMLLGLLCTIGVVRFRDRRMSASGQPVPDASTNGFRPVPDQIITARPVSGSVG